MPAVLAWTDTDENSAWVQIGSGEKQTDLSEGDKLGDAEIVDGKCLMPTMKMGLGGDLSLLRVGADPDTCEIVVKRIVAKETDDSTTSSEVSVERSLPAVSYED